MVDVDMIDCDLVGFLKSSNLQVITTELKTCETISLATWSNPRIANGWPINYTNIHAMRLQWKKTAQTARKFWST